MQHKLSLFYEVKFLVTRMIENTFGCEYAWLIAADFNYIDVHEREVLIWGKYAEVFIKPIKVLRILN